MPSSGDPSGATAKRLPRARSEALEKLKRGEWTLDEYLDDRVENALAKVAVALTAEQRESARETLRFQIATDPVLGEYARLATGQALGRLAR